MLITRKTILQHSYILLAIALAGCEKFHAPNNDTAFIALNIKTKTDSMLKNNPGASVDYFQHSFGKIKNPGPKNEFIKFIFLQKYYRNIKYDYNKALLYTDSATTLLKKIPANPEVTLQLAQIKLDEGDIYLKKKQYNNAYLAYYNARNIANDLPDDCEQSNFSSELYTRIANINYGEARFKEAINWFSRSANALATCGHSFYTDYSIQGKFDNIALCYEHAGMPDSAQVFYDKALAIVKQIKPTTRAEQRDSAAAQGVILGNKGSAFFEQQKYDLAKTYFAEAIKINSQPGFDTEDALITRIKLTEAYLELGQMKPARQVLDQIAASADTLSLTEDRLRLLLAKANYFKQAGDFNKASELYTSYVDQSFVMKRQNLRLLNTGLQGQFELIDRNFKMQEMEKVDDRKTFVLFFWYMV